jgi:DNA-binding phage protein
MPPDTHPFDLAAYLDSDAARAAYLTEATAAGDPTFIADSLKVIARSIDLNRAKFDSFK